MKTADPGRLQQGGPGRPGDEEGGVPKSGAACPPSPGTHPRPNVPVRRVELLSVEVALAAAQVRDADARGVGVALARVVLAIAAADRCAARETVITGETGSLVPPGNATALAAAIDRCLSMPEAERIKLSNRAMTHAEKNFSREKMVNQTFDVYAEILHDLSQKSGA